MPFPPFPENEMNNQAAQTMPEPVTASMCPSSDYAKGWNDCRTAMLAAAPAARVDDRVQRLIDEARRCAGSTGDLSDLRAALMPFEGDY